MNNIQLSNNNNNEPIKFGIFSDIHFQDVGLNRIIETSEWILSEFNKNNINTIVCLGDVLNTREKVSIKAQSTAIEFFEELLKIVKNKSENGSVHILCGNHDLHLKYNNNYSSLDILGLNTLQKNNLFLYKNIIEKKIGDFNCIFFPYLHDTNIIKNYILQKPIDELQQSIGFCHMSINGAIQRYQVDNKNNIYCKKFEEKHNQPIILNNNTLQQNEDLNIEYDENKVPKYLTNFKRLFSGHFHHFHFCHPKIIYSGSPMQHHFGDSGDSQRGILIYDPLKDDINFLQNPKWDTFRTIRLQNLDELNDNNYKDKYISIIYENLDLIPNIVQKKLLDQGAKLVKTHSIVVKKVKALENVNNNLSLDNSNTTSLNNFEDFVDIYVNQFIKNETNNRQFIIQKGKSIISQITKEINKKSTLHYSIIGNTFQGNLKRITIQNFLGIQNSITFQINEMENGIWFLEGENGSGKSTILEAITWCLFERFLRSDMKVDFAVNDKKKNDCLVQIEFENGYMIERFRKYSTNNRKKKDINLLNNNLLNSNIPERKGNGVRVFYNGKYLSEYDKGSLKDSQLMIENELLGVDFETFTKSIVIGDNFINFLTSDAKQRREMIENLLGLYLFDEYLNKTKELKKDIIEKLNLMKSREELFQSEVVKCQERINQFENDLNLLFIEMDKNNLEFENIKKLNLEKLNLKNKLENICKLQFKLEEYLKLNLKRKEIENEINEILQNLISKNGIDNKIIEEKTEIIKNLNISINEILQNIIYKEIEIKNVNENILKLNKLILQNECPYCKQNIEGHTHIKMENELKELEFKNLNLIKEKEEQELKNLNLQNNLKTLEKELNYLLQENKEFLIKKMELEISLNHKQEQLKTIQNQEEELKTEITKENPLLLQNEDNYKKIKELENLQNDLEIIIKEEKESFERKCLLEAKCKYLKEKQFEMSNQKEKEIEKLKDLQKDITNLDLSQLQSELNVLEFWEKAFDRKARKGKKEDEFETMRSFLLEKSINDLNNILEEYSKLLGRNALPITFDSDLMISESYGKRSAGQRKRNHLVIFFALFELVRQRSRFLSNFLMLDEMFDALDVEGQEQVQQVIQMISNKIDKIFIISHSTQNLEMRKRSIRAIMTNEGSMYQII